MKPNKTLIAVIVALLLGAGGGYWLASRAPHTTTDIPASEEAGKPLFYRNPMNPEITSPVPAQDEMGMDYLPVYADEQTAALPGTVKIDPVMVQDMGVRTKAAQRATLARSIRTSGRVTVDEERLLRLHPKYDGWVEELFVHNTGDAVRKGDMLLSIYSPQLVTSEEEYLLALENAEQLKDSPFADVREGAQSLLVSSEQRLRLLDIPEHQIAQLKEKREIFKAVHIHAPQGGIVMSIGAREGERIQPSTELYLIADLSRVWVMVDLYEDDMPWVREGDRADLQVAGIPGRTFSGKLTRLYPYLDAKTRTLKARLEFANPDLQLKPDMFGRVTVQADRQVEAIAVPSEAIVRTGTQEQVFVQRAPGQYEPRKVVIGVAANGQTQIVSGLNEGEIVVTSAQFLIDSESKLKEATAKMLEAMQQPAAPAAHDPAQHDAGAPQ